ncbi:MAG: hypothetical protein GX219_10120 [Tissierellia bacterium]|nr:hypothetical protein [Tissierellia bacterium]
MRSIFGIFARSSIYKILTLFLGLVIADVLLYIIGLQGWFRDYNIGLNEHFPTWMLMALVFFIVYLMTVFILARVTSNKREKNAFTLQRLSSSEREIFIVQTFYNIVVFTILWAVQLAVLLALALYHKSNLPVEINSGITIFGMFHFNRFLNLIFPLSNYIQYLLKILLIIWTSLIISAYSYRERGERANYSLVVYLGIITYFYGSNLFLKSGYELIMISMMVFIAIVEVYNIYKIDKGEGRS